MAIDWSEPAKERDCPLCSTETEVIGGDGPGRSHGMRKCPNRDCGWKVTKSGRWSSPRRPEDYPVGSIGWEEGQPD